MGLEEHAEYLFREKGKRGYCIHCKSLLDGLRNLEGQSNWSNECVCICVRTMCLYHSKRKRWRTRGRKRKEMKNWSRCKHLFSHTGNLTARLMSLTTWSQSILVGLTCFNINWLFNEQTLLICTCFVLFFSLFMCWFWKEYLLMCTTVQLCNYMLF